MVRFRVVRSGEPWSGPDVLRARPGVSTTVPPFREVLAVTRRRTCPICHSSSTRDCAACFSPTTVPDATAEYRHRVAVDAVLDAVLAHVRAFGAKALAGEAAP